MSKSLLDLAKEASRRKGQNKATQEQIELAVAWALGEVTLSQVSEAIGLKRDRSGVRTYLFLAQRLREHLLNTHKRGGDRHE
jgi:hypothetical protein